MIGQPVMKNTLSYIAGGVFLIAIGIYIYLMVEDRKQNTEHTQTENFWIYLFLVILILGFFFSYYFISRSNNRIMKEQFQKRTSLNFVGQQPRIPIRGGNILKNATNVL